LSFFNTEILPLTIRVWLHLKTVEDGRLSDLILVTDGDFKCVQQVCNPAIQFMLYEGMMKKLTEKRRVTSLGSKHVSASEVSLITFYCNRFFDQLRVTFWVLNLNL